MDGGAAKSKFHTGASTRREEEKKRERRRKIEEKHPPPFFFIRMREREDISTHLALLAEWD